MTHSHTVIRRGHVDVFENYIDPSDPVVVVSVCVCVSCKNVCGFRVRCSHRHRAETGIFIHRLTMQGTILGQHLRSVVFCLTICCGWCWLCKLIREAEITKVVWEIVMQRRYGGGCGWSAF